MKNCVTPARLVRAAAASAALALPTVATAQQVYVTPGATYAYPRYYQAPRYARGPVYAAPNAYPYGYRQPYQGNGRWYRGGPRPHWPTGRDMPMAKPWLGR